MKEIRIPLKIFRDRNFKPLEAICRYMKDELKLSYHEIALLLNRNDRTIWTCYHRAKKKEENK